MFNHSADKYYVYLINPCHTWTHRRSSTSIVSEIMETCPGLLSDSKLRVLDNCTDGHATVKCAKLKVCKSKQYSYQRAEGWQSPRAVCWRRGCRRRARSRRATRPRRRRRPRRQKRRRRRRARRRRRLGRRARGGRDARAARAPSSGRTSARCRSRVRSAGTAADASPDASSSRTRAPSTRSLASNRPH